MANPFDDETDFGSTGKLNDVKSYSINRSAADEIIDYDRDIERILKQSIESTQRSVQRLDHSEQLGNNTAAELLSQREKLEHTEKNLDAIHQTTQDTQRNINSIKSWVGGFFRSKLFRRAPAKDTAPPTPITVKPENKLSQHLNADGIRALAQGGEYLGPSLTPQSREALKGTRFETLDNKIDENLDLMSSQLSRLRNLTKAIGDEVDEQNQMLDRIQVKATRNEDIIRRQDDQIKKLLG